VPISKDSHWSTIVVVNLSSILKKDPERPPFMFHVDSLKGHHNPFKIVSVLKQFLVDEFKETQGLVTSETGSSHDSIIEQILGMSYVQCRDPYLRQVNVFDCGFCSIVVWEYILQRYKIFCGLDFSVQGQIAAGGLSFENVFPADLFGSVIKIRNTANHQTQTRIKVKFFFIRNEPKNPK
jgi:hypothetical protein